MAPDPYKYFRLEVRELLDQFAEAVLALEKSPRSGPEVQRLLRLAHTLKGAARVVKKNEIAETAHVLEDELAPLREGEGPAPRAFVEAVLRRLEEIRAEVSSLDAAEQTEAVKETIATPDKGVRTVRADLAEMDALLEGVSETYALLNGLRPAAQAMEQGRNLADMLVEQLAARKAGGAVARSAGPAPDKPMATAEALRDCFAGLERSLGSAIDQMERELRQVRTTAEQLRLVPASMMFTTLERTAHDSARAQGKQVNFSGTGGNIRMDAYVLGTAQKALVQIVRNAVAHGIEDPNQRRAAGKPSAGAVTVNVSRRGRQIVFECRDDGRGLDLDAVRRVAAQRGLLGPEARRQGAEDMVRLLLRGGISTSNTVTEVSGRGIGLDVVREAVEKLAGNVAVSTQAGLGAVFELTAPLSIAALNVLAVEVDGTVVTIPFDAVRCSMLIPAAEITRTASGASVVYDEAVVPFLSLPKALYGITSGADQSWSAVVVAGADGLAAVGVDRLLGSTTVVMHPTPEFAPASAIVAGASLDAEGNPQLVLDPDGLVAQARGGDAANFQKPPAPHPVLIIDDFMTTRMLEQSILQSAGYEVDLATTGEEGLEAARRRSYGLFLVDVEMPGIDGFTFIERIRLDPALRDTPAVLVTSRNAPEDYQRGRDVGAQGYVVKSQFDQAELLALIKRLME